MRFPRSDESDSFWEWYPDLDHLSHAELKSLVVKQFEEMAELRRTFAALRDEIARLKGGPRRFHGNLLR